MSVGPMRRVCDAQDVTVCVVAPAAATQLLMLESALLAQARLQRALVHRAGLADVAPATLGEWAGKLSEATGSIRAVELADCPFDGEVEVAAVNDRLLWRCPMCRTEHDQDATMEGEVVPR